MPKSVPAFINPAMLTWAREQARLSPAAAAKAIGVPPEKLEAAEKGDLQLTFPQFLAAANAYKRAPSLFYLDEPPVGFQPIQDFRKLSGTGTGVFSSNLIAAIRQARERRDLALQLHIDLGEPVAAFGFTADISENEEALGERIRNFLGVSEAEQQSWRGKAFDNWRGKIEARNVLVFLVPGLPLTEMRGVAIAENQLPLILVNSKDRTNGRTFTLIHEFCHLAVRASGVSGFDAGDARTDAARVERFCNAVAGATLVPGTWLLREPLVMRKGGSDAWDDEELRSLALHFGVSREVVLRRLLTLGRTSAAFYESRRAGFQKEYEELNSRKATGAPPPPVVKVSQLGRAYAQLIFQGYYDRRLTLRDVSNYFNMQVKAVPALEQAAFGLKG